MKKNSGRWLKVKIFFVLLSVLCFLFSVTGCGPQWKRKFVRKRAEHKPEQVFIYEPKEYQKGPNDVLYKKYFLFWKAWQEELITKLGDNKKSDLRCFEEALKNLGEMKQCLADQKAIELQNCINDVDRLYNKYKTEDFSIVQSHRMRADLNRLMLRMDKQFRYNRVKEFIK